MRRLMVSQHSGGRLGAMRVTRAAGWLSIARSEGWLIISPSVASVMGLVFLPTFHLFPRNPRAFYTPWLGLG